MSSPTDRDRLRLAGVHEHLRAIILTHILPGMAAFGTPMFVVHGVRTAEEQHALWLIGRTPDGVVADKRIIRTWRDGYKARSNHQPKADGYGHAVDLAFVDNPATPGQETFDPHMPWDVMGAMGEYYGLVWGGRWVSPVDMPHLEFIIAPLDTYRLPSGQKR